MPNLTFDYKSFEPETLSPREKKLVELWENHTKYEFVDKDVDKTMETMTASPHNINVPTLTGGVGADEVRAFYNNFFVSQMPEDIKDNLVSRTIGFNRIVDEIILEFTHSIQIDWILPGIKPTNKKVSVALVAITGFKDEKIDYEHIYWDQASVLVQVGLLDKKAYPVVGEEGAQKIASPSSLASNQLIKG